MTAYSGPCEECGKHLERDVRPGRKRLHIECAVLRMERQHREWADRESAAYRERIRQGELHAEEYRTGGGVWYKNWLEGMANYIDTRFPMEVKRSGTVANEPTATRRKPTRRQQADGRYQR